MMVMLGTSSIRGRGKSNERIQLQTGTLTQSPSVPRVATICCCCCRWALDETGVIRSERIRNEWRLKESALVGVLAAKLMLLPA